MLDRKGTALVKRASVEDLVGFRNAAIDQWKLAMEALARADDAYCKASSTSYGMSKHDFAPRTTDIKAFIKKLDSDCWRHAARMTKIETLMDVRAREKFNREIADSPPEFNVENVLATLTTLMESAGDIFHSSVVATFEALPRAYKSNDGFKYGKRIIFDWACDMRYTGWHFYVGCNQIAVDRLQDLDRVMHVLDGAGPEAVLDAITACQEACRGFNTRTFAVKSRYFEIKGYAKGSLHIRPLRKDLLDRANRILAAHYGWKLADGRAAA